MANRIAIPREQQIFVVEEPTRGTLTFPSAGTDLVVAAGTGVINQQPSYTESEEIVNSRDILAEFQDRTPAGSWNFPIYIRPGGNPGDKPMGAALFKALLGNETVNAGSNVTYSCAMTKPSLSLWLKKSHTIFFARGVTVGQARLALQSKGGVRMDLSGGLMEMGWVGTDELASAIDGTTTPVTSIPVVDAKKFKIGGRIQVGTNDNAGSGYEITAVDVSTNTLTVTPGVNTAESAGTTVEGFLPSGTIVGSPLEARTGYAEIDSVVTKITGLDLTISDMPQYLEDELSTDQYPSEYVEVKRRTDGNLTVYFRQDDLHYFYDAFNNQEVALKVKAGSGAGSQFELSMPRTRLSVPEVQDQDPTVALNMGFLAKGTSGEDSVSIIFS